MRCHAFIGLLTFALLLGACQTGPRNAPVTERKIDASEPSEPSRSRLPVKSGMQTGDSNSTKPSERDWRPETYAVKRGDTLYTIALDHGLDYRELAAWNGLADPNRILAGQVLSLRPSAPVKATAVEAPVIVSKPSAQRTTPTGEALAVEVPLKTEPRAERIPYSDDAFAKVFGPESSQATTVQPATDVRPVPPPSSAPGSSSAPIPSATPPAAVPSAPGASSPVAQSATPSAAAEPVIDVSHWLWPARGNVITAFDGTRSKGIAIAGKLGDAVTAANAGKVVYVGKAIQTYGALVILKHGADFLTVYANNSSILVREGQWVSAGQKIAEMGERSPKVIALHFELRKLGQPVDPAKYLASR